MDLSGLQDYIPNVAGWLHLQPSTVLFIWWIIATASNAAARAIPANSTGWRKWARQSCAVVGVYVPVKVAPGVTIQQAAVAGATQRAIPSLIRHETIDETVRPDADLFDEFLRNVKKSDPVEESNQ